MTKQSNKAPTAPKAVAQAESPAENPVELVAPVAPADEPVAVASGPTIKGRVLRACVYGPCDAVVEIPVHQVEALAGVVDTDPAAVAYAESLKS